MYGRVLVVDIVDLVYKFSCAIDKLPTIYLLKQRVCYLVDLVDETYRALFKSFDLVD